MANTNYNYLEAVTADVKAWIEDNMDLEFDIMNGNFNDLDEIREHLNDTLWTEDSVTGNASGSYTFNREEAKEYVFGDIEAVAEALREFCTPAEEIAKRFLEEDFEYFDVTARCYYLGQAIDEALDEIAEDIEAAFERRDEEAEAEAI